MKVNQVNNILTFFIVMQITLLDKLHLQKYIYLLSLFTSNQVTVSEFENLFLQLRRDDNYWMNGLFSDSIGKILDALFLDVDEYTPPELYDTQNKFNIDEKEFRQRATQTLQKLIEEVVESSNV